MGSFAVVRQVRLRPECADHHPTLPASMWTSAAGLTELVRSYGRPPRGPGGDATPNRTLGETDFDFRGGGAPRGVSELLVRTRFGELSFRARRQQVSVLPGDSPPEVPGSDHQIY